MARLRLLLVAARYLPLMGGIETHTYEVARRLASQGVEVTVLTTDNTGRLPVEERVQGVLIRRVRAWPTDAEIYFAPGLSRVIAEGQWDVMHCEGCHTLVPPVAMRAARRAGLPYLMTFHTGGNSARWRNALRGMQWRVQAGLMAGAERWIGVSQYEIDYFSRRLGLPAERCHVIPNGSDLPQLTAPVAPEPGLIISAGRLERFKGHQRVIAALPEVRLQLPEARLLILGSGPYEGRLRQLADETGMSPYVEIKSIPPKERQTMARTLARAGLVTLLSEAESHPVAVMEAMLLGRPVLVADTSGLSELAKRRLVRAIPLESDATHTAAAITEELREPMPRAAMKLPTWDDCAAELLKVYEAVAVGCGRARAA